MIKKQEDYFILETQNTSYIIHVLPTKQLEHFYYGEKIELSEHLFKEYPELGSFVTRIPQTDLQLETRCLEFSTFGTYDLRNPSLDLVFADGSHLCDFTYHDYEISQGVPRSSTPHFHGDSLECLQLILKDEKRGIKVILTYHVIFEYNVITKSITLYNESQDSITIESIMSSSIDFYDHQYDIGYLQGTWGKERTLYQEPLSYGIKQLASRRGASSHSYNPGIFLAKKGCSEYQGQVYGFNFVYSGNFLHHLEVDMHGSLRLQTGIHPQNFAISLLPNTHFQAPEVVMCFSNLGYHQMSEQFVQAIQHHFIKHPALFGKSPILLNNWEATYFDFNKDHLLALASKAAQVGVELFVLDDGWFGQRNNDSQGLGDWFVNEAKLAGGLEALIEGIHHQGLQFGLWFEPEMVNEDSDLYREHPDWIFSHPFYEPQVARNQYVLNCGKQAVQDHLIHTLSSLFERYPITYVKWDSNRNLSDVYDAHLPHHQQGALYHEHIQGIYRILDTLTSRFPHILFEGCSGGGGRFDLGMLYYMPQIWTSDNTDAIDRLSIQYGTSFFYPHQSMGAHISAIPNHQTHRITPLTTRSVVASAGTYGLELDLTRMSEEELHELAQAIATYKHQQPLLQQGSYYRCSDVHGLIVAWYIGTPQAGYLYIVQPKVVLHTKAIRLQLPFLQASTYLVNQQFVHGSYLRNHGIEIPLQYVDGASLTFAIQAC